MQKLIQALCGCSGVSSREDEVRQFIRGQAEPYADAIRVDALGNLIVFKKGRKSTGCKVLLDAPMDEIGVMVSGFTEEGALRFQTVGPVDRRTLIGKRVYLGEKKIPGIIGMKPIHLSTKEERKLVPKQENLSIDIGAKDQKAVKAQISLGEVGCFSDGAAPFGEGNAYKGKGLYSRVPCAVLLQLLQEPLPVDCTFVFAAQALVGARGAFGAGFSVKPQIALCLGGSSTEDGPLRKGKEQGIALGKGVVLPVTAPAASYDRELFALLRALAEERQIPWQLKAAEPNRSNAQGYQRGRNGVRVAGLAVPVRHCHCPVEVASLEDGEAMLRLTRAFLEAVSQEEEP